MYYHLSFKLTLITIFIGIIFNFNQVKSSNSINVISNNLIPKLFKNLDVSRENVVFSSIALVQNLAVVSLLTNDRIVTNEIVRILGLNDTNQLISVRKNLQYILTKFEIESNEGENSTEATGLFNYLHINPEHKIRKDLIEKLENELRTNITDDTSLDGGAFTLSADTGILSSWKERESLIVFTLLQHTAEAPFYLHNGTIRKVPLVPHIGHFSIRKNNNYTLVRLPLQAPNANLILVLPENNEEFIKLTKRMSIENLLNNDKDENKENIELWIPQMLAISSVEFKPILRKLGVEEMFKIDFSMASRSSDDDDNVALLLEEISQKSFFSTSFTSVKSITESEAKIRAKRQIKPKTNTTVTFNKPFLFFIERTDLKLILTSGTIIDPIQYPTQE